MSDERIINRVKKLMALANDAAASDGERDNALRMAYATMAKYNLNQQDVDGKPVRPQEARVEKSVEAYGRPWACRLAVSVAELFFCKYLYQHSFTKDHVYHCFVGKESNAQAAAEVTEVLIASIFREAKRRMRAESQNVTWRRSFCTGAMFKVSDRVHELQTSGVALEAPMRDDDGEEIPQLEFEKAAQRSTALVLVDLAKREVEANAKWVQEKYGDLRSRTHQTRPIHGDAYKQGRSYGESLNLAATKRIT